jgi:hypothetical protein
MVLGALAAVIGSLAAVREANAQMPPPGPPRTLATIPLEYAEAPAAVPSNLPPLPGEEASHGRPLATQQGPSSQAELGIADLRNPFEWGSEAPKRRSRGGKRAQNRHAHPVIPPPQIPPGYQIVPSGQAPSQQQPEAAPAEPPEVVPAPEAKPVEPPKEAAPAPGAEKPQPTAPPTEAAKPAAPPAPGAAPTPPAPGAAPTPPAPGAAPTPPAPGAAPTPPAPGAAPTPPGEEPLPPLPGEAAPPSAPGAAPQPGAAAPSPAATAAAAADTFGAAAGGAGPGFGGGLSSGAGAVPMIGDQSPFRFHGMMRTVALPAAGTPGFPPPIPGPRAGSLFYPSVRNFKISENQSPRPQDRFFVDFNYYNNINDTINTRNGSPIDHIKAYRYLFGGEKTFNDGKGSIGLRFPINNVTADSLGRQASTPTSTAMGDLTIFGKYILEQNPRTGSLASVGLAVTTPTGPARFAGAPYLFGIRSVYIQPFFGYIYNIRNFYLQGFTAFDFPSNFSDTSMMYNDFGMGYFLIRSTDPDDFLTTLAPTFEVHVNTPLNHRDWFNPNDLAGSPDVVNLTYGLNFGFRHHSLLTMALITPVSSPQPFNTEVVVFLNVFYGRSRAPGQVTPPLAE